jgi:hypothetical protein
VIQYPLLVVWAACALIILTGALCAVLASARLSTAHRSPIRRAARRTAHSPGRAAQALWIPVPHAAPDYTTTVPTGVTTPTDRYRQHHAEELNAVLGCTCPPTLGGTPTVNQTSHNGPQHVQFVAGQNVEHTFHQIDSEYEITYLKATTDETTAVIEETAISMLFTGPTAEEDAYAQAELLLMVGLPEWRMRTRTVETVRIRAPWIDAASAHTIPTAPDLPHRLDENGHCLACESAALSQPHRS